MHYLKRKMICDRLRLSRRTSYDIVGSAHGSLVSSDEVIALLNRSMRETKDPCAAFKPPKTIDYIPSDLLTPDELAAELAESGISARDLWNWAHRKRNIAPHFRLTKRTIRFSRAIFFAWLDARSRLKTLKKRVA